MFYIKTNCTVIFLYCTNICFCVLTNQHTETYVGTIKEDYCTICFYLHKYNLFFQICKKHI